MAIPDKTKAYLASPLASTAIGRFVEGFSGPIQGLRFLNQNRSLWRYAVLPIVFNLLITAVVLVALFSAAGWFVAEVHPRITAGLTDGWWWLAVMAEAIAGLVLLIVCGVIAVVIWKILSGVLCGVFLGRLAEEVELTLGLDKDALRSISWTQEVVDTLLGLTMLIVVNTFLFTLNIVPVIGGVISVACSLIFTWYLLGVDNFGFPLSLRGDRRADQYRFGRRHWMHNQGLGCVVLLFEFIPIVGAVFLTTAVVGAVMLHKRIEQHLPADGESNNDN